jgi:hypothetical protein
MIRRAIRILLAGITLLVGLSAVGLACFTYTRFFRYQAEVDTIYERIPAEDRHVSAAVRRVLEKTEPDSTRTWIVSRSLLAQIAPARVGMAEWNLRGVLWDWLLPMRFDPQERLILFANVLPFDGGSGLTYGARKYFEKRASQLDESEALQLLAITFSPGHEWTTHPDRFRQRLETVTQRYRRAD